MDLLSGNFTQIWYRIWADYIPNAPMYHMAKTKFETTFCNVADPQRLRRLISTATHAQRMWEIPKGKKSKRDEPELNCAVREFREETNITKKKYKIIPGASREESYIDESIRYTHKYFFALAGDSLPVNPQISATNAETCEVRWMTMDEIRLVDTTGRLEELARPILRYVRKHYS